MLLCKLFRRKVLIHQHNKGMSGCVERWPYHWLLPLVYRNTRVMLLSWHLYDDISKVVKREQVVVCANGIPQQSCDENEDDNDNDNVDHTTQELSHTDFNENENENENCLAGNINLTQNTQNSQNNILECEDQHDLDTKTQNLQVAAPLQASGVSAINDDENEDENENCAAELQANSQQPTANSQAPSANSQQLKASLLFLSNLIPSKGVYVLLDACKVLKERGLDFVCDFVGGETKEIDRATFEAAVKERDLEGIVCYHGPKYGEEKEEYWQRADVFVQPTFDDCFPLTLVEAMQHRLPIVSTDVGAIPDMIKEEVNGFICPQRDVDSLVTALEKLITDPALRQQMGEQGYQRYQEEFTLEAFERRFVAELKALGR